MYISGQREYGVCFHWLVTQEEGYHAIFCDKNLDYPVLLKGNEIFKIFMLMHQDLLHMILSG